LQDTQGDIGKRDARRFMPIVQADKLPSPSIDCDGIYVEMIDSSE